MKRSSNTPATFIAIPWTPAGRPKRNSARMTPQSGRQSMPRCHVTGSRPESNKYAATPLTTMPATVLPTAAPAVPKRGKGPRPVMNATLHAMLRTVRRTPKRSGVAAPPPTPTPGRCAADCGAGGAQAGEGPEARDERPVARDVEDGEENAQAQRRARAPPPPGAPAAARTPLRLGVLLTVLNIACNVA